MTTSSTRWKCGGSTRTPQLAYPPFRIRYDRRGHGSPTGAVGSRVAGGYRMFFRRVYWRLVLKFSAVCLREWIAAR
jgi:hypothetical protein